jgi:hypothetical protein
VPNDERTESSDTMPDRMFASTVTAVVKTSVKKTLASNYKIKGFSDEAIRAAQRDDCSLLMHINKCLANGGSNHNFTVDEAGILYKLEHEKRLLMVPHKLQATILHYYHNHAFGAHLSRDRMIQLLQGRFYWIGLHLTVADWIKSCSCQAIKKLQPKTNGLLQPIVAIRRGQIWEVDLVGPIGPSSAGNKYMLVAIDCFSNWPVAAPLKTMTAAEVVRLFFKLVIKDHGCPEAVLSDQGTQFMSDAFNEMCESFNIKRMTASAYHHQTAGKILHIV